MKKQPSGKWISCKGAYRAFVPNPLPPKISFSSNILNALSEADRLIGRLAGEGCRLPNPHLLMRPFLKREAVLSSRIEGTQATLGELLAVDAGAHVERSPDDLKEVGNYVSALEHGIKRLPKLPLSLRLVLELHGKLMKGVRGEFATPGQFRRTQNWIGLPGCTLQTASFIPPPPDQLMDSLGEWETFIHTRDMPPLIQIALLHYQFEAIHPFLDGNGRVGRLLITLFLIERDILPTPLLYLSAFFEATRRDYYDLLSGVSQQSEWEPWILYFLSGVARMSEDALSRASRINALVEQWTSSLREERSDNPARLAGRLAENPYCTVTKVAQNMGIAFATAQRTIDKLVLAGILQQVGEAKRDRVYCAVDLMKILNEPPTITP